MFTLTIASQMTYSAAIQYPFDEEVPQEFQQDLYDMLLPYEDVLPAVFFEAIKQRTLFTNATLMQQFQVWCELQIDAISEAGGAVYEQRPSIVAKLHESAALLLESFHDGQIVKAKQQGENFELLLNMRGGFVPHAYIALTFEQAMLEGSIEGYYLFDELVETADGFALRVLSSYGSPYIEGTLFFKNVRINGVFRPAVYTEPRGVETWAQFVAALPPHDTYWTLVNETLVPITLQSLQEEKDGIYAGDLPLGKNYEEARELVFCSTYEDPYAHFSEPIADDELIASIFCEDETLRVRAFNTLFARERDVAPIVTSILQLAQVETEPSMYFKALAYRFDELGCLPKALADKWLRDE